MIGMGCFFTLSGSHLTGALGISAVEAEMGLAEGGLHGQALPPVGVTTLDGQHVLQGQRQRVRLRRGWDVDLSL